jgi:hypothetical protein
LFRKLAFGDLVLICFLIFNIWKFNSTIILQQNLKGAF